MPEIEDLSGRRLGEFVLRARIGEGGFGAVYRCEQPLLGREAVVKVLHPRLRHNSVVLQRFLREAQLASQLDHPGAAHIYAFGIERDDGLFWIAMEMVQGVGLNRWLHEQGPMPLERFVPFFEQLAEVVHAAHERGIVHRDLKPSNVMVIERAGRLTPKLLDFGVAKLVDGALVRGAAPAMLDSAGDAETVARTAAASRVLGSMETVTRTATTPSTSGRDLRRLTYAHSTVGSPPYMSPEQWLNAADVGPSSDLYALGVVAYEATTGRRPFNAADLSEYAELHCDAPVPPVGEGLPPALDRFFERALAKRPEQRWRTALELAAALRAEWIATRVSGATPADRDPREAAGDDEAAPYLGLAPYAAGDAGRFVGREAEVAAFLERLQTRPLHVVVGPPGTGKSSFVHAGVLSGLPPGWRTVALRPGAAPLAALAFRLEAAGVPGDDLRTLLVAAPAGAAARVAEVAGGGTVVVVIDQLEELFTLGASAEERGQFAAAVAQLAASADLPVRVIATIRDDFLMQLDALPALRSRLGSALVLLGNPLHDDLVRVVVEPARRAGYALSDPELAHDMVRAVASRPGALALLSFTALRLWELRDRTLRQLTRSAYDAMDGVSGALVRHAEATFEALSADDQRLAREMFRQLVTADGARAPLTADELHQRLAAPRSAAVLDRLIAARLLAISDAAPDAAGAPRTQVEVIHDALLEAWPRLRRWIRDDLDGVRMREQLRIAARQWSDRGRPSGLLWRDDTLVDLQRWLRQPRATQLSELEAAFVEASLRIARRARRRRAIALVAAGAAAVLAVVLYSGMRSHLARRAAEQQLTRAYVDRGQSALLDGNYPEALVYLAQAARRGDQSSAVRFMFERAAEPLRSVIGRLPASSGRTWSATFSPDGRRIVTTDDARAQIWDAQSLRVLHSLSHDDLVFDAAFTPDGAQVATAGRDGTVRLWSTSTGLLVHSLTHAQPDDRALQYHNVAVSPRGDVVAALRIEGRRADVWERSTGRWIAELVDDQGIAQSARNEPSLQFSPDGRWIAIAGDDGVHVHDTASWELRVMIAWPRVRAIAFHPAGAQLATASDGDVSIWEVATGERARQMNAAADSWSSIAWSPDGRYIAAGGRVRTQVWKAASGDVQAELRNDAAATSSVEFDPSSRLLLSALQNGAAVVSDVALATPVSLLEGPRSGARDAHFDPTGQRVIAASWDGAAWLWNARPQYLQAGTPVVAEGCSRMAIQSVDSRFAVLSCAANGVWVSDTRDMRQLAHLPFAPRAPDAPDPAVSTDGDRVAVPSGNDLRIYDSHSGTLIRTVDHASTVTALAFAPQGHAVLTGTLDGALWLTRDDTAPARVLGHVGAEIDVVDWVPDGRALAVDTAPRLHVYDPRTDTPLAAVALAPAMRYAGFRASADGRRLLVLLSNSMVGPLPLLDLERYQVIAQLDHHKGVVFSARFFEDDHRILTAANDGTARIWDAERGELQRAYPDRSTWLTEAAIDPAGAMLVTGGGDGILRFWDLASGRKVWSLRAHRKVLMTMHFDGTDLVTRGFEAEVARWRLPPLPGAADFARGIDRVLGCLPIRFDEASGGLIDQDAHCEFP